MSTILNPRQNQAVRHIDGPCLVLAGAGSGKTRVITHKIAYLIQGCAIDARHIAAVTFTNKAAREMKERVGKLLRGDAGKGLRVSTFHTLGLDILRREYKALEYKAGFSIYDSADSTHLLKELMKRSFGDDGGQAERMLWQISRWKSEFILPEQALQLADGDANKTAAALLYEQYRHYLKTYNAVDFDDLIMLPVILFREHPEILERWQNRIRHLLVDEYQDTNSTQYELVKQLCGVRGNLTVVGDDDQSIYAWRGAQPENLSLLQQDYPNLKVIKLEQNYRSTGCILKAANRLIASNPHIFEKRLWSELGYGDPIRVIRTRHDQHEAEQVVSEIMHHMFVQRTQYADYAILYRGNHQSRLFEQALREHDIPYYLSGGTSFFAYTEIKDIMSYLKLITNPDDDNAFRRIINTPRRELGPATLEKLTDYAMNRGHSLFVSAMEFGLSQVLSDRATEKLQRFCHWILDLQHQAEGDAPASVVKRLIVDIDYERYLLDNSRDEIIAERKLENVNELANWFERLAKANPDASLNELVTKLTLLDTLDRNEEDERGNRVHLMTLHAAKGLEFPHVYLVGMEEMLLPHRSSIEEESLEEERRLAYVGITRAQKTLTFTYANQRKRHGEMQECSPSRFIDELPDEDLKWSGEGVEMDPEERQQRGQAHLANLRSMLLTGTSDE
ncbi:MAG: DNA helicase Rep [Thiohalophilus sp.]|uniref:DNA helicase Rep n=1 Tax=Thiohalophilus sp. TaxID=3028392 RepID=UPI0028701AA8|nr:DNA helicase Rep [Thiohalophilus sp.]MDR9437375.1 DNA helicase Rep [Thiohalophilus sp.]